MQKTMEYIASCGVREKVIVHCKKAGFVLNVADGAFTAVGSLSIPRSMIRGSVGAGDAFCAGCLYALYHHYDDTRLLEIAGAAAGASLFSENSVDGMLPFGELEQLLRDYPPEPLSL